MKFDITQVPFSRYGSYLAFSRLKAGHRGSDLQEGLYLRTVHGASKRNEVLLLEPVHGGACLPCRIDAEPSIMRVQTERGFFEVCFAGARRIRVRGAGIGLKLSAVKPGSYDNIISVGERAWVINLFTLLIKFRLELLAGSISVEAPWNGLSCDDIGIIIQPGDGGGFDIVFEEYTGGRCAAAEQQSFERCAAQAAEAFKEFLDKVPAAPVEFSETRELAAYVNWSCMVEPNGLIRRPAMLMSKNWMNNVWSWDHCFNAIALCAGQPDMAWDQFMVMFDHQDENGALPDSINDRVAVRNFYKPPIHGWALMKMVERGGVINRERLLEAYEPLCRWTEWWFDCMDDDGDGIPAYNHGNDSGWDNSTVFTLRPPVESPDLAAFLILQMEALSYIAGRLGRNEESVAWKARSERLLSRLLEHSRKGDKLVALTSRDHRVVENESLLPYIPLLLGRRLPPELLKGLVAGLRTGGFLTEHGLATESVRSPLYIPDGYWRGPIWAPSTMLIVDGLRAAGETGLAGEIAAKFLELVRRGGCAENFDALTGQGLRDRAYTWTSSVFLILAGEIA